jgi:hypothetical protein
MCFEGDVWSLVLSMIWCLGLQDKDNKIEEVWAKEANGPKLGFCMEFD